MNAQAALLYKDFEPDEYIGKLIYSPSEEARIHDTRIYIENRVKEAIISFITGERDIYDDIVWNEYINEIYALELAEFVDIAQTAYNRSIGN